MVSNIPVFSGLLVAITPMLIDLLVGFVLGALLVMISLVITKITKKSKSVTVDET